MYVVADVRVFIFESQEKFKFVIIRFCLNLSGTS